MHVSTSKSTKEIICCYLRHLFALFVISFGRPLPLQVPSGYNLANFITAGNSNRARERRTSSNVGKTKVHLFAPGTDVIVLHNTKYNSMCRMSNPLNAIIGGLTEEITGTSFSSPITAGAVALLWGLAPEKSFSEIRSLILDNVSPVAALTSEVHITKRA